MAACGAGDAGELRRAAVIVVLIAALGGCGGDDGPKSAPAPPNATGVETTIREAAGAVADGNGREACSKATEHGRRRVGELLGGDCVQEIDRLPDRVPAIVLGALRDPVISDVRIDGERARARVEPPPDVKALARAAGTRYPLAAQVRLVRAGDRWLIDDALPA